MELPPGNANKLGTERKKRKWTNMLKDQELNLFIFFKICKKLSTL